MSGKSTRSETQDDCPSVENILLYWSLSEDLFQYYSFFSDWNGPICWSCGRQWKGKLKKKNTTWDDYVRAWENAPLQRCHIVAKSLGGSNHPSNFFLMCRECHDLSPNTTSRQMFFRWVDRQDWWQRDAAQLRKALRDFDIDATDEHQINEFLTILQSDDFKSWSQGRIGIHRYQQLRRGSGISESTLIAAVVEYRETFCP